MRNRSLPLVALLAIAVFALLASSCDQGGEVLNPLEDFVGTWSATVDLTTYQATFAADGTGTVDITGAGTGSEEFAYWATSNILWIMPSDPIDGGLRVRGPL